MRCAHALQLLPPVRAPDILARPLPIHDLPAFLSSRDVRHTLPPLELPTVLEDLVALWLILSRPSTQIPISSSDEEVRLRCTSTCLSLNAFRAQADAHQYHPHGIISHGAFAAFATEALGFSQLFPGITNTLLTLDSNFRVPFYRDYLLAMGLSSVSRTSCENLLNKGGANGEGMGRALTIVVGGAAESLDAQPRSLRLVLAKRKGFVKLAVRAGADLVPVLAFGENDLYEQITPESHPGMRRFQLGVKKVLGFTVPFFFARGIFNYDVGLLPYRRPLDIVVGRAIKVVQAKNPDEAYVAEIHALYVRELKRIWEEWKGEFAKGMDGELEIVE